MYLHGANLDPSTFGPKTLQHYKDIIRRCEENEQNLEDRIVPHLETFRKKFCDENITTPFTKPFLSCASRAYLDGHEMSTESIKCIALIQDRVILDRLHAVVSLLIDNEDESYNWYLDQFNIMRSYDVDWTGPGLLAAYIDHDRPENDQLPSLSCIGGGSLDTRWFASDEARRAVDEYCREWAKWVVEQLWSILSLRRFRHPYIKLVLDGLSYYACKWSPITPIFYFEAIRGFKSDDDHDDDDLGTEFVNVGVSKSRFASMLFTAVDEMDERQRRAHLRSAWNKMYFRCFRQSFAPGRPCAKRLHTDFSTMFGGDGRLVSAGPM